LVGNGKTPSVEFPKPGILGRLVESAIGYLTVGTILLYPIGILVLSLQLWNSYAYTYSDALFAASLAPIAIAVVRIFSFLVWGFIAMGIVQQIAAAIAIPRDQKDFENNIAPLLPEPKRDEIVKRQQRSHKNQRRLYFLSAFLMVSAPCALHLIPLTSWRTWVLYAAFVSLSCTGGIATGVLGLNTGTASYPGIYGNGKATLVAYAFGIVAGFALAGTSIPSLPLVALDTSTGTQKGRLLAHKEGYWYLFDTQKRLRAVSDADADNVKFLRKESQPTPGTLKRQSLATDSLDTR
jgi:hypothetical protein